MLREQREEILYDLYESDNSLYKLSVQLESCIEQIDAYIFNDYYSESVGDAISNMIQKIKDAITSAKKRIQEFFASKKVKNIETQIENNPELKNKRIEMVDYSKLDKANEQAMSDIDNAKSKEDIDKAVEKHASTRKKIIAGATVAVTVAAGIVTVKKITKKMSEQNEENVKKINSEYEKKLNKETKEREEKYKFLTEQQLMAKLKILSQATKDEIDAINDFSGKISSSDKKKIENAYKRIEHNAKFKRDLIDANKNISDSEKFKLKEKEIRKTQGYKNMVATQKQGARDYVY